jgi:hypothetical protein
VFKPYQVTDFSFDRHEPSGAATVAVKPGEVSSSSLTVWMFSEPIHDYNGTDDRETAIEIKATLCGIKAN